MKYSGFSSKMPTLLKPLLVIGFAILFTAACKESAVQGSSGPPSGGGMPSPGGGMPPPGGGMPSPGGGMPSPGGGSSGGSSSPDGGSSDGGADGGAEGGAEGGGAGDVGTIPPPPGQGGGGSDAETGGGAGDGSSGGGGEENPFGDADESDGDSDCGDTGALPGGIGGMGREGECLSGGEAASESESESSSAAESGGGGGVGGGSSSGGTTGTGGAGSVGEFPAESAAERAERLGRELDESIGGFDETLGAEQREIAAAGRVIEGFDIEGGDSGDGSGAVISLGGQSASAGSQSGMVGGGGSTQSEPLAGMTQQEIEELTPDDVPTMVDDDIIARQLREAAIVEKDPDLRDRLWDEYRKYKGLSVAN